MIRKKNYEITQQRKRSISKNVEHLKIKNAMTNRIVD